MCKAHESEKELLAALLEHARIQVSARENSARENPLQELRAELEAAQRKASEEQRAAEELREKLQNEESARRELEDLHALQTSYHMRDFHHNRAFRADVTEFLQKLGQRYPEGAVNRNCRASFSVWSWRRLRLFGRARESFTITRPWVKLQSFCSCWASDIRRCMIWLRY